MCYAGEKEIRYRLRGPREGWIRYAGEGVGYARDTLRRHGGGICYVMYVNLVQGKESCGGMGE